MKGSSLLAEFHPQRDEMHWRYYVFMKKLHCQILGLYLLNKMEGCTGNEKIIIIIIIIIIITKDNWPTI